jgi:hypothetical protein
MRRGMIGLVLILAGAVAGFAAGYSLWGGQPNWYAVRDVEKLPPGGQNDLVIYGYQLVADTQRYLGPDVADAAMRFAGNNLACGNCHLRAGLQPFAAPFVSTYTTFPMMVDDRVITLSERINGCMTRSMNGRALPVRLYRVFGAGNPDRHSCARDGLGAGFSTRQAARRGSRSARVCCAMRKVPRRRRERPSAQRSASRRI